jgi:Zn-dependent oligopeptidase
MISTFEIIKEKTKEIINLDAHEDTNFLASFSHLFDNYDAGYYGYMYSKAFAIDLFSPFKNNELDPILGKKLKDEVLCYGSIRPSIESVKIFLGREANEDAFIESII